MSQQSQPPQSNPDGILVDLRSQLNEIQATSHQNWRERAMENHRREQEERTANRFSSNPRLYGHVRQHRTGQRAVQNQLTNLRELRANMQHFDSMLDDIERFQQQTESLVENLRAIDNAMGNRELEPVDDEDPSKKKGLDENDLAKQKLYNYDPKVHKLKDPTCSICLVDIELGENEEAKESSEPLLLCELTCGHTFHANCVLSWLTNQSHCCPNCR